MILHASHSFDLLDIFLDSLIDSLKVLLASFIVYFILGFFEAKISNFLTKHKKTSPLIASAVGLVPQCGVSVICADLYTKRKITMGTVCAIFFSCSDEALPILFTTVESSKMAIVLLLIKFVIGFIIGYSVDIIFKDSTVELKNPDFHKLNKTKQYRAIKVDSHMGCCNHEIEKVHKTFKEIVVHPLLHSLKIFMFVFIINISLGILIGLIKEENIEAFLDSNIYFTPLFSTILGLIPNCASSVIITELFVSGTLPFSALVSGLCINSGLGIIFLLKNKRSRKDGLKILSILFLSSLIVGYIILFIMK